MSNRAGVERFLNYLTDLVAEHNPETCRTPGHIVIRDDKGNFYCGPGGYWPQDKIGIVNFITRGRIVDRVQGTLIRVNEL